MSRKPRTDEEIRWILNKGRELDAPSSIEEWLDLLDEYNAIYGRSVKAETLSRLYRQYRYYDLSEDHNIKRIKEHRNIQLRNSKIAKENRQILDSEMVKETFLKTFENIVKENPLNIHAPAKIKLNNNSNIERVVVGHISDTHIGAEIDVEELGGINSYTYIEEARRHAFFFKQLAEYKTRYRDKTSLLLVLNGDLMQGVIHDQEDAAEMTTQFARALNIYVQGISYVSRFYKSVKVVCTTGNHARFMHKSNKGRVSSKKWDGFHSMLHIGIRTALSNYKNVEVEIPVTPYASIDVLGHHFFIAHGDTVINLGNVSKTINMANIASQVNDITAALGKVIDVLMAGHVHKSTYQTLDNGTEVVINGPLSGTDPFAQSIGILHNNPCQQMFEVTENHAVGDMRFVRLKEADQDESLDKIIKPLQGKF